MSDEDKAKVEKEFLEQGAKDRKYVEQTAAAKRMVEAVREELHQKYEGDEKNHAASSCGAARKMLRFGKLCSSACTMTCGGWLTHLSNSKAPGLPPLQRSLQRSRAERD
jgi:hypothetical protein